MLLRKAPLEQLERIPCPSPCPWSCGLLDLKRPCHSTVYRDVDSSSGISHMGRRGLFLENHTTVTPWLSIPLKEPFWALKECTTHPALLATCIPPIPSQRQGLRRQGLSLVQLFLSTMTDTEQELREASHTRATWQSIPRVTHRSPDLLTDTPPARLPLSHLFIPVFLWGAISPLFSFLWPMQSSPHLSGFNNSM